MVVLGAVTAGVGTGVNGVGEPVVGAVEEGVMTAVGFVGATVAIGDDVTGAAVCGAVLVGRGVVGTGTRLGTCVGTIVRLLGSRVGANV